MGDLRKFKVIYWNNGNKCALKIDAYSKYDAKARFYLLHPFADIIRIEEVSEE